MGAGSNPSTVGTIRMANNTYITARDSTNSSNAQVIGLTSSDDITIFGGAWFFRGTGRLTAGGNYGFSHGVSALATTATEGFLFIQSCAGTPTGVPANIPSGQIAAVYDSTNKKVYLYDGGWKRAQVGGVDAVWA
jgi:hypothetical protein